MDWMLYGRKRSWLSLRHCPDICLEELRIKAKSPSQYPFQDLIGIKHLPIRSQDILALEPTRCVSEYRRAVWQCTWLVFWTFCTVLEVSKRFGNWIRSHHRYQFILERGGRFIRPLEVMIMLVNE
jgi:hypothetical protein